MNRETLKKIEQDAKEGKIIVWIYDDAGLLFVKAFDNNIFVVNEIEKFFRANYINGLKLRAVKHGKEFLRICC